MNISEEYLICEFSCLLAQVGGTLGIFFGVSLIEVIHMLEWIIQLGVARRLGLEGEKKASFF